MKISVLLALLISLIQICEVQTQTVDPTYFWDFSKVTNLNGNDWVFEQTTKDEKLAFGLLPPRTQTCVGNASQMTYPQKGPEGVFFKQRTDSMRLENANNLGLGNKYQIAVWYKLHPFNWCFYRSLLRIVRYDYYTGHFIEHGANCFSQLAGYDADGYPFYSSWPRFHWYPYAYSQSDGQNSGFYIWGSNNVSVQEGWFLQSISIDASSGVRTSATIRTRGPGGYYDNIAYSWGSLIHSEVYWPTSKADMYLGAWCYPRSGSGFYADSMIFTMGRMYMWKGSANLNDHKGFDKFFFRKAGAQTLDTKLIIMPECKGKLNCTSCIVDYPFPDSTVSTTALTCITDSASNQTIYWVYYDFDSASNNQTNQFILDLSGNGYHLQKRPTKIIGPDEIFRIYGQGFLFYNGAWINTVQNIPIDRLNQFTIEVWCRKLIDGSEQEKNNPPGVNTGTPFLIYDPQSSKVIHALTLSDQVNQTWFCFRSCQNASSYQLPNGILQNDTWHYFAISFSWLLIYPRWWATDYEYYYYTIRHQINNQVRYDYQGYWDFSNQNVVPSTSYMQIGVNDKTMIYKSLKVLKYARYSNDDESYIYTDNKCADRGPSKCNICPRDSGSTSGKCLSTCKEEEYGDTCKQCHKSCGHCTGPNSTDCVYCNRNRTISSFYFNEKFGNCSCRPHMFYNSTTGTCNLCDSACQDCFGKNYTQCLTCAADMLYFPNTTCVQNCSDVLVKNGTNDTFFQVNETFYGQQMPICRRCHPFCDVCNGTSFTNCINCSAGFFLQKDNVTCLDECPDGQYPDNKTNTCKACHADCATCIGPNATNCLLCSDPNKKQLNNSCYNNCTGPYYPDSSNVCQQCSPECTQCTAFGVNFCTECADGSYLKWMSTTCQSTCPSGTYPDEYSHSCLQCHYSCQNCTTGSPDTCITCALGAGYLYSSGSCVTTCQPGEFIEDNSCKSCNYKCQSCYGPQDTQCISCNENKLTGLGYYFFNNSCLDQCPKGYYPDNLRRLCVRCPSTCAQCISSTFCTECVVGPYQLNNGECTFFTCMETQYRGISPKLSCFECDSSCKTCQGFSKFDCLTCSAKSFFNAQQCLSCNQQPGMMNPLDESIVGCQEICGDGFNYGYYQCDDGNLINGDGCSSQCTIESGFNCTTGSKFSQSVCMDNQNPSPRISLIGADNTIYLSFDEEVYLKGNLDTSTLEITVAGPQSSYSFDWRLEDSYKKSSAVQIIGISMNFYSSIKGNSKEIVTVKFLDDHVYQDATGNGLIVVPLSSYLNKFDYIDPATKAQLDSASDTSIMATYGVVAINLVISQLFGGSIAAMWTMVNTLQLLSLLPLCNINYPSIVVMVLQKMLTSHGESTAIPNIFYTQIVDRPGSKVKIERALNNRFSDYGWTISNFIYLSGRKILLWMMLIFIYPFVWYMKNNYSDKHKLCQKWIGIEQKFRYTLLLRGVIMSYVSMYLAFLLGIFKMDLTTMENTISAFTAIAFGIMLTFLPVHLMNILQRNYERIETEKFMLQYSTIVKEVDLSHPIRYMFYPVFLLRRALFAIELVIFADTPVQQIIVMSLTAFAMIIYVSVIKPQKEKVMIVLTAVSEGLLLVIHLYSYVFLDPDLPDEKANSYGFLMLAIIGIYIISNWVIIIKITIGQLKQKWAERKIQKQDKKKKEQEDQEYKKWKKKRSIKQQILKERARSQTLFDRSPPQKYDNSNNTIMISRASNLETSSPLQRRHLSQNNQRSLFDNKKQDNLSLQQIGSQYLNNSRTQLASHLSPIENSTTSPEGKTLLNQPGALVFTLNEMINNPQINTLEEDARQESLNDTQNIFYAKQSPSMLRKINLQSDMHLNQLAAGAQTGNEQDAKLFKQVMFGQNRYKSSFQSQSDFGNIDKDQNGLSFSNAKDQLRSFNSTKDQREQQNNIQKQPDSSHTEEIDPEQMLDQYLKQ